MQLVRRQVVDVINDFFRINLIRLAGDCRRFIDFCDGIPARRLRSDASCRTSAPCLREPASIDRPISTAPRGRTTSRHQRRYSNVQPGLMLW